MNIKKINSSQKVGFCSVLKYSPYVGEEATKIISLATHQYETLTKNISEDIYISYVSKNGDIHNFAKGTFAPKGTVEGIEDDAFGISSTYTFAKPVNVKSPTFVKDLIAKVKENIAIERTIYPY